MLKELVIENFALMENVHLQLTEGLSVFTGETGAGKSMLIDALGILLGGRISSEMIRFGTEKARVEGIFTDLPNELAQRLEDAGYPLEERELVLFRELNISGRNTCRFQGRTVPLSLYRTLCEGIVDIHGQMEHQSLFNPSRHRQLLDALGGTVQLDLLAEANAAARQYHELLYQEQTLRTAEADREKRLEFLKFQIDEIDSVKPLPGEEESLNQAKKRIVNAERIINTATEAYAALFEGSARGRSAYDALASARKALGELTRLDPECTPFLEQADTLYFSIEELADEIRGYRENSDVQPGQLDVLEERLHELHRLQKYGASYEDIMAFRHGLEEELEKITGVAAQLEAITGLKKAAKEKYQSLAARLTQKRHELAEFVQDEIGRELSDLGMEKGRLLVKMEEVGEPALGGNEQVEFYFTANLGEPPKPLSKVASGGEMSRLMLALKSLLAQVDRVGTFVFDEVDSGVGGRTIRKVGEKLAKIAQNRQVLCITHAPHVAAFADTHFGITKEIAGERTRTRVTALEEKERVAELARMLGGDQADIAYRHAEELWQRNFRKK